MTHHRTEQCARAARANHANVCTVDHTVRCATRNINLYLQTQRELTLAAAHSNPPLLLLTHCADSLLTHRCFRAFRSSSGETQAGPPQPAAQANGFAPDSAQSQSQSQSNSVSARFSTLQAYIADLEAEKFELQRGLQKQQATMAALAEDQRANDERFQSLKSEHSQLESDVQQYAQALSAKVR